MVDQEGLLESIPRGRPAAACEAIDWALLEKMATGKVPMAREWVPTQAHSNLLCRACCCPSRLALLGTVQPGPLLVASQIPLAGLASTSLDALLLAQACLTNQLVHSSETIQVHCAAVAPPRNRQKRYHWQGP